MSDTFHPAAAAPRFTLFRLALSCACLLLVLPSCGAQEGRRETPPQKAEPVAADVTPQPVPAPELKAALTARLADIRRAHDRSPGEGELTVLIHCGKALVRTLAVTAEALDRDRRFAAEIERATRRLAEEDARRSDDPGRVLNTMTGMYEMYDILARMRFHDDSAAMTRIGDLQRRTMRALAGEKGAMNGGARMAAASYELTGMIMRQIDTEKLFAEAFARVQNTYRQGEKLAKTPEDRFLNGVYRTYEISQLWLLALDPGQKEAIGKMNDAFRDAAGQTAENLGMQLTASVEFLYRISFLIADRTVQITL